MEAKVITLILITILLFLGVSSPNKDINKPKVTATYNIPVMSDNSKLNECIYSFEALQNEIDKTNELIEQIKYEHEMIIDTNSFKYFK